MAIDLLVSSILDDEADIVLLGKVDSGDNVGGARDVYRIAHIVA